MNRATVPEPIRQVLDTFRDLASNPPLYRAGVYALNFAMMEIAAEVGPCPACGSDTGKKPTQNPQRVVMIHGDEFCAVCGEAALVEELPEDPGDGLPPDFDPEAFGELEAERCAYYRNGD